MTQCSISTVALHLLKPELLVHLIKERPPALGRLISLLFSRSAVGSLKSPVMGQQRLEEWRLAQTRDERPLKGNRSWAALVGGRCPIDWPTEQPQFAMATLVSTKRCFATNTQHGVEQTFFYNSEGVQYTFQNGHHAEKKTVLKAKENGNYFVVTVRHWLTFLFLFHTNCPL